MVLWDPVEVGHTHTGGRPVVGEDNIIIKIDGTEVGEFPVVGLVAGNVFQLQLFDHIRNPSGAKRFPGANV